MFFYIQKIIYKLKIQYKCFWRLDWLTELAIEKN